MLRRALLGRRLPDRSDTPRLRHVEDQLLQLRTAPDPDPRFRSELRAQLVAIAPRLVAEGASDVEPAGKHRAGTARTAPAGGSARHTDARGPRFAVARTLRVATALVAVCALLLGGAYWKSRNALPGDNLYSLKRAGERVELSLAGSTADKAKDQLEFANRRYNEVLKLWQQHARPSAMGSLPSADPAVDDTTSNLIKDTLTDANSDLFAGASGLNSEAVRTRSAALLQTLTTWAATQDQLLTTIKTTMAENNSPLANNVGDSAVLVRQASQRAAALNRSLATTCRQHDDQDRYGPLPCGASTSGQPSGQPSGGGSSSNGTGGTGGTNRSGSTGGPGNGTTSGTQRTGGTAPRTAAPTGNPASSSTKKGPNLPLPTTPARISVGSKCVSVSVGPIGVGVGCPSH